MKSRIVFVALFVVVVASGMGFLSAFTEAATKLNDAFPASSAPVSTSNFVADPNNVPIVSEDSCYADGFADGYGSCVHKSSEAIDQLTDMVIVLRRQLLACMHQGPPIDPPSQPLLETGWDH